MFQGRLAFATVALFALLGVALAAAIGATAQDPADRIEAPDATVPNLKRSEARKARKLAVAYVRKLGLGDAEVAEVGVWHAAGSPDKLGAVVMLHLPAPARLTGAFPRVDYDPLERKSYTEEVVELDVDGVTQVVVTVDLQRSKIVEVVPAARAGGGDE
jgi:hypothetical protein